MSPIRKLYDGPYQLQLKNAQLKILNIKNGTLESFGPSSEVIGGTFMEMNAVNFCIPKIYDQNYTEIWSASKTNLQKSLENLATFCNKLMKFSRQIENE